MRGGKARRWLTGGTGLQAVDYGDATARPAQGREGKRDAMQALANSLMILRARGSQWTRDGPREMRLGPTSVHGARGYRRLRWDREVLLSTHGTRRVARYPLRKVRQEGTSEASRRPALKHDARLRGRWQARYLIRRRSNVERSRTWQPYQLEMYLCRSGLDWIAARIGHCSSRMFVMTASS